MPTPYSIRRANLEDLLVLQGLWETARLPVLDLERRLTDFHVALRPDGVLVGAIALRSAGSHGLVYGECYTSTAQAQDARPVLCERILSLARNHGCTRLWMRATNTEFWHSIGFRPAGADELTELPSALGERSGQWCTLVIRRGALLPEHLAEKFARLQEEEHAHTERLLLHARLLKWVAGAIAVGFFAATLWLIFKLVGTFSRR